MTRLSKAVVVGILLCAGLLCLLRISEYAKIRRLCTAYGGFREDTDLQSLRIPKGARDPIGVVLNVATIEEQVRKDYVSDCVKHGGPDQSPQSPQSVDDGLEKSEV